MKKFPALALLAFPLVLSAADSDDSFFRSLVDGGNGVEGENAFNLGEIPELKITRQAEKINEIPVAPAETKVYPEPERAFIFESELKDFSQASYDEKVEKLIDGYERTTGKKLVPAATKKCALKIYTESGKGLETPKNLVRAVRAALVKRGFAEENIYIVGHCEKTMRKTGYLPPFRRKNDFVWENSPVIALDTGKFYDSRWFFESALPSLENANSRALSESELADERKSYYPVPLMFGVDFWISLPTVCDNRALGVSGALANISLWNIGNNRRFLNNPANAVSMVCAVATLPELRSKYEFTIMPLEKYQFIGGPEFNENYVLSEKALWLSANPVVLDFIMWQRMNKARQIRGFDLIVPEPEVFSAASRGEKSLGSCLPEKIRLIKAE